MKPHQQTESEEGIIPSLMVGLARIEEKVDGVIDRLDKQNGSIVRLTEKTNKHESELVAIGTKNKVLGSLVKPAVGVGLLLCGLFLGHMPKQMLDFIGAFIK